MRSVVCVTVLLVSSLQLLDAQALLPLEPGQRVRITAPEFGLNKQAAVFEGFENGMLIATADSAVRLPLSTATQLEVSAGQRGYGGTGALIGLVGGAVIGGAVGYLACNASTSPRTCFESQDGAQVGFAAALAAGAAIGTLAGYLIGRSVRSERWEEISLDNLRVGIGPQRGGRFALAASVRF